jgi:hypothetical protein
MGALGWEQGQWIQGWLCVGLLPLLACGGQSASTEVGGSAPESATSADPTAGAAAAPQPSMQQDPFGTCPTPLGTADELARTPRSDTNLELLALALDSGQLTATQATYERVVADVTAIRESASSLATIEYWPLHDGRSLLITFGSDAMDALGAGTFSAWDCLLATYRAEVGSVIDVFPTYSPTITLGGIFDMVRMEELFEQLPDISADISFNSGRSLCSARSGEHYEYVVDRTSGPCDGTGACRGSARHFASDAPGEISLLAIWSAASGDPPPAWFRDVCK